MPHSYPESLIPNDDAVRLRTLHQFQIVNTTPELIFDNYTAWAAQLFNVPISIISLVDKEYVWFKSRTGGPEVNGLVRDESMCAAAILTGEQVILSDYKSESCTLIKPDVAQAIGLNFYAGAVLTASDGARLGMLAAIGKEYREPTAEEIAVLVRLADLVTQTIELRYQYLAADQAAEWEDAQRALSLALDENVTLARYLITRNQRIDLTDPEVAQLIDRRLSNVAKVLSRRLSSHVS
ncbi:MAG TPA: GAF domain-containing protein [Hymenobacter sp.]|uniref:GAF domain-containing protein n=1 Tax=Hymenobacter sp. TaxID=1898978 RepID=UPI002D7E5A7D|nr:GAF domain-containing protein [Hymenobacter sp.]HET9503107.1 GAF domain-containing protein [Hymenobacter sp.]